MNTAIAKEESGLLKFIAILFVFLSHSADMGCLRDTRCQVQVKDLQGVRYK